MLSIFDRNKVKKNILEDTDIEYGSNANGEYIKFPNGTLICYGRNDFAVTFTASGYAFRGTAYSPFTFPYEFSNYPNVNVTTTSSSDYTFCSAIGVIRDKKAISLITFMKDTSFNGNVGVNYIAIGLWK